MRPAAFTPHRHDHLLQLFTTIDGTGTPTNEVATLNPDGSVPDSGPCEAARGPAPAA